MTHTTVHSLTAGMQAYNLLIFFPIYASEENSRKQSVGLRTKLPPQWFPYILLFFPRTQIWRFRMQIDLEMLLATCLLTVNTKQHFQTNAFAKSSDLCSRKCEPNCVVLKVTTYDIHHNIEQSNKEDQPQLKLAIRRKNSTWPP